MKPIRVALVGATSHIAKGLVASWCGRYDRELLLYARAPERVAEFLAKLGNPCVAVFGLELFGQEPCDVVVNCVGVGSPSKLKENLADVFRITAVFDDMIIDHVAAHPETLYVNLSSGAAYGVDFSEPVYEGTQAKFALNDLRGQEFYGIAKLHAEAKHRARPELPIVDIRVFGYFSRYIDLSEKFLLSEMLYCLKHGETFVTADDDIWRDVLHPRDMAALVDACIESRPLNRAYDAYSLREVSKFEILQFFADSYGLKYRTDDSYRSFAISGQKSRYYPTGRKALEIGYAPAFTSLEGIRVEASALIAAWRQGGLGLAIGPGID